MPTPIALYHETISVTRAECFAKPEEPSAANPYKQRWFYDPEAGYAVRLERNQRGEETYRTGAASLKRDERYRDWRYGCVLKGKEECGHNCESCTRRNTSRTVELDMKSTVVTRRPANATAGRGSVSATATLPRIRCVSGVSKTDALPLPRRFTTSSRWLTVGHMM
jgi:hypothetical protein